MSQEHYNRLVQACDLLDIEAGAYERGAVRSLQAALSILASQRDDLSGVSQLIEIIGPSLHHPDALGPVFGCM
jgi:hypothetical protein